MEPWMFGIIIILVGVFHQETSAKTHFKYMTNYCSETIQVTASLVVVLAPPDVLKKDRSPDYFHCSVDLMAAKGTRLQVHFLHLSISSHEKYTDRLKLFDVIPGRPRTPLTPVQGLYGMLDRSMVTSDKVGATVGDFRSAGRWMQVEYLGKPTQTHSGFRMLVTTTADKDEQGKCPASMYTCEVQQWCIPSILACDGYPNCGGQDNTDENGCDLSNLVSSVSYSLMEDIFVIVCIPVLVFILGVVAVVLTTRWHVNKRYPPPLPTVKYTHVGDGQVAVGHSADEPPSYTEAINYAAKPPAYNTLETLECEGVVKMESDDDDSVYRGRHFRDRMSRDIHTTSTSSIEQTDERRVSSSSHHRHKRVHRPTLQDTDYSEDKKIVKKGGRKGGKSKSAKCKRRADDLCAPNVSHVTTSSPRTVYTSLPHSTTSISSPLVSPSSPSSAPSNPSIENVITSSSSAVSSFSSTSCSLQAPPTETDRHKSSSVIPTLPDTHSNDFYSQVGSPRTTTLPPVAILPLSTSSCVEVEVTKSHRGSHPLQDADMSSGPEGDRKSETESVNLGQSNNKTESCTSLSETPANSSSGSISACSRPMSREVVKDVNDTKSPRERGKRNGASRIHVKRINDKVAKAGENRRQNGSDKVISGLIPLDSKVAGADVNSDDDYDDDCVDKELYEDADVSSESDAGVEVDLRRQEVVRKKNVTMV